MSTTTVRIYCKLKSELPRNKFLWANTVIIDDTDDMCPVIEGWIIRNYSDSFTLSWYLSSLDFLITSKINNPTDEIPVNNPT